MFIQPYAPNIKKIQHSRFHVRSAYWSKPEYRVFDHIRWMVSYIWMVYVQLQNHLNAIWISFFMQKRQVAECYDALLTYATFIAVLRLVSCAIAFPLRTQLGAIDASCVHHTYFTRDDNVCNILTWKTHTHIDMNFAATCRVSGACVRNSIHRLLWSVTT